MKAYKISLVVIGGLLVTARAQQRTEGAPLRQYIVLIKRGPNWIPGKSASEQPLSKHGKYLKELMDKGSLQMAGQFLDDSGGLVLLNAADDSEARRIAEHDPGVLDRIIETEVRPFRVAFDAATGKSPFQ